MSSHNTVQTLSTALILWDNDEPKSGQHQDIYFSRANGLAETRYVFLEQNQLPKRWENANASDVFTIVETGFGTGLNFLSTWQLWQQCADPKPDLAFVSVEKFPISHSDLERCLSIWPELGDLRQQLLTLYPEPLKGNHLLRFEQGRVQLNLILGDVNEDLGRYPFVADCWFLDGFAPGKNADMWQEPLFELMKRRSRQNATFATFTAAGFVRRALAAKGFNVERTKGFGPKRDMLRGQLQSHANAELFPTSLPGWACQSRQHQPLQPSADKTDVIVIGAGMAGITTAHALAQAGLTVQILERQSRPMAGASGQNQLALYAKFPALPNKEARFLTQCLSFSQRHFQMLQTQYPDIRFWHPTGLLQLAWNTTEQRRLEQRQLHSAYPEGLLRVVDASEGSRLCGINVNASGVWFEQSGWLDPHQYAQALLSHSRITMHCDAPCHTLNQVSDGSWLVATPKQEFEATHVVLASAYDTNALLSDAKFPLKTLRGQVTTVQSDNLVAARSVICGEGYLCPPHNGEHHFGATYDLISKHDAVLEEDNQINITTIRQWLPDWLTTEALTDSRLIKGNAGMRCTTPDYFPIAGPIHKTQTMTTRFARLRHNANSCKTLHGEYHSGLFINVGHGSKGLVTIPACAEWISAQMTGKPGLFNDEAITAIHPARFLIRGLIKNLG